MKGKYYIKRLCKKITLYRGLREEYKSSYDLCKTDAPNGYSTWTDNEKLAWQYAGLDGYVYSIQLPLIFMANDIFDANGERTLFLNNEKLCGLNGIGGNEYLVYHHHELFPDIIEKMEAMDAFAR